MMYYLASVRGLKPVSRLINRRYEIRTACARVRRFSDEELSLFYEG